MPDQIGVINPYALADAIKGERVNWHKLEKEGIRDATLANILLTKEKDIFDLSTPVLNPFSGSSPDAYCIDDAIARIQAHWKVGDDSDEIKERKERIVQLFTSLTEGTVAQAGCGKDGWNWDWFKRIFQVFSSADDNNDVQTGSGQDEWNEDWFKWKDMGDFIIESPEYDDPDPLRGLDIVQGSSPDCYFIAALSSVLWSRPTSTDLDGSIFAIYFYRDNIKSRKILVSDKIPVTNKMETIIYAKSLNEGEIWPGVMEKAYASWRSGHELDRPQYSYLAYGNPVTTCTEFFRVKSSHTAYNNEYDSSRLLWEDVEKNCLGDRTLNPMVAWTFEKAPAGLNYKTANIVPNHAYSILGCEIFNQEEYIILRNPYGVKHATVGTREGEWSNLDIQLNENGLFSMKASVFKVFFQGLGWARRH